MSTEPAVWLAAESLDAIAWLGSTLRERIAASPAPGAPGAPPAPVDDPADSPEPAWLARWKRLYAPAGPAAFDRRLAWDGLDRSSVVRLGRLRPSRPEWIAWLSRIESASVRFALGARLLVSRPSALDEAGADPVPFALAWAPVIAASREALAARAPHHRSVLSADAMGALERALMADLSAAGELALHAAWVAGHGAESPGASAGGHDRFVRALLLGGWADLWRRYPVLARRLAVTADQWVNSTAELADRLLADRERLAATFGRDASLVSEVRTRLADPHDGGRRVIGLGFTSGLRLAYKPRDLGVDAAFHRLVAWLSDAGLPVAPPHLEVLPREGYGWMAWAEHDEFESLEQVSDYYRRAGSLMCLAHLLGASDLHAENIVATRGGPVLVDAEALLQPLTEAADAEGGDRRSCLLTGLLSLVHVDGAGQPYDVGGLRAAQPRTATVGRRRWHDLGTDRVGFDVETIVWPSAPNVVRVADQVTDPGDHADQLIEGFALTWGMLERHRESLLAPGGPISDFASARVRVLFRSSDQYDSLLHLLDAPDWQRDGMDRSVALDTLNRVLVRSAGTPRLWPLVADEQDALERGDLPRFTVRAGYTALTSHGGATVEGHFAVSGLDAALARLRSMTDEQLAWQRDQIESVLRSAATAPDGGGAPDRPPSARDDASPSGRLLAAAELLGADLLDRSRRLDQGAITWPGMGERVDLYDGQAGPALALAALAMACPARRWGQAWRLASAPLVEAAEQACASRDWRGHWPSLGATSGVASGIYALAWLGRAFGDEGLLARAVALAHSVGEGDVDSATDTDVERGLAGLVLVLVGLHRVAGDDRLMALAERAAARLVALGVEPAPGQLVWPSAVGDHPAGFGHGVAGIALALARVHGATRDAHLAASIARAVRAAWRFERHAYSASEANWPVARADGSTVMMLGWCHGAPGIGMARALTPSSLAGAESLAVVEAAMRRTAGEAPSRFDHLCCGNLARAEALLTAGLAMGRQDAQLAGAALAGDLAERVLAGGATAARTSGFETGQIRAGFFQGLSGIVYELARAADPRRLPSVLALDLPGGDA